MKTIDLGHDTQPELPVVTSSSEQFIDLAARYGMHREHMLYILHKLAMITHSDREQVAALLLVLVEARLDTITTQPTEIIRRITLPPRISLPAKARQEQPA